MSRVTVRKATKDDLPTLYRFEQGMIDAERPFIPNLKEGAINYYDLNHMLTAPHIHLVVAEADGVVVGSGYARIEEANHYLKHPKHAYIGFMFVEPAHRGRGINKIVLDHLMQWASAKGMVEMVLDVYYDNEGAIKAYEKAGFIRHLITMRREFP